jgi:hypothetical protein
VSSLFGSAPAAPPAPPPVEYVNTRDEVGGTQSNYVTNPDGTKTLVTSQLPLTAEQQAYKDQLNQIATDSLDWVNKLSTNFDINDPSLSWLKDEVQNYTDTQVQGADKALADRANQEEKSLARFGQADSTAGIKTREQRGLDYSNSRTQITRDASSIQDQLKQQALGNATNLYSLATGSLNTQLGQLMDSIKTGQNFQLQDGSLQQNRNLAIYQGGIQQQGIKAQSDAANLANLAQIAGLATYAAGPQGFALFGGAKAAAGK